ncbi:hypothetical protein [Umezawaea tangerina]|uniref:Uncharacterized protein n=1 Tax=Umezawaea tangerina TaxID=84725 RepID=A0A2T0SPN5_9PSEU|nr:hypothetical protein [Umezawaea tangerina]PRY35370.1 hypothetical protein CLV43_114288 [Umezawaea tangerina]
MTGSLPPDVAVWQRGERTVLLPTDLLVRLEQAWAARNRVNVAQEVHAEVVEYSPKALDVVESSLRQRVVAAAAERNHTLMSTTGPLWTQRVDTGAGLEPDFTRDVPWQRGTPLHDWAGVLVCRISGLAIPLIEEAPPSATAPDRNPTAEEDAVPAPADPADLKTPAEWAEVHNATVTKPDGWTNGTRTDGPRGFDEPITGAEFARRCFASTVDHHHPRPASAAPKAGA